MLSDIIIVAVIILFIIIGVKRGLARTILGIIGLFVTYAVASGLSDWLSIAIYDSFLEQTVVENISSYMNSYGLDYVIENNLSALPEWIGWLVSLFGGSSETVAKYVSQTDDFSALNATSVFSQTIETMTVSAMKIVLMIVFLIVVSIIVRKLVKLASKAFNAPVLRQVNGFFGGVLGAAEGVLFVFILVNVLCLIAQVTANDFTSSELIDGYLFSFFNLMD